MRPGAHQLNMQNLQRNNDKLKKKVEEFESVLSHDVEELRRIPKYGSTLVNPSEHSARLPCLAPARGATRHFTRTFTIQATAAGDSFGIKLNPSLSDFVTVTNKSQNFAVNGLYILGTAPIGHTYDNTTKDLITQFEVSQSKNTFEFVSATSGAALNTLTVFNNTILRQGYLLYYKLNGIWVLQGNVTCNPLSGATVNLATTYPVPVAVFGGISIVANNQHSHTFTMVDTGATALVISSLNRPVIRDEWITAGQIERSRIAAMSMLVTYRGNMLENAGVIASARAPCIWKGGEDDLYKSICKLSDNKYKGPIVEGTYIWWLPMDAGELDFIPGFAGLNVESTSLYVGGIFGDDGGSMEVTLDVIVDFYSPLQIFERKLFPPMSDAYFVLLHDLSQLPAGTCNPKHLDILKKGAKAAASGIMKGYDLALKHPEMVNVFLKALAALAV